MPETGSSCQVRAVGARWARCPVADHPGEAKRVSWVAGEAVLTTFAMRNPGLSALLFTILWLGCGSEDRPAWLGTVDTGSGPESIARGNWCDSLCNSAWRCQAGAPTSCKDNCWRGSTDFFARTSAASLEYQSRCMDAAACPANFDELPSQCWRDSVAQLEPSDEAEEQCEALGPEFFACDWFASHDSCVRFHANFSRSALANERKCAGMSCDALDECISKQLYGAK